ncbi:GntR family transcriptional regulator [Adhaeribacter aerolatus]|uniref:GntR family transcriptional regulator n=1 Tax=Adhaeribacter aerolatus TaxID=670289 RepID=A0A512B423_9BACT|nr:S1-like domain-containing RNA-binding protein [Adhaeribacter aerolatus]GEO06716.1 GntR family transcriptional regulator [Adhaeribacter aerolatus]
MVALGDYNELEIIKQVDFGVYLDSEDGEILLPQKYLPEDYRIGDLIRVFVYRDSEDRIIATTLQPKAKVGDFAALEVKQTSNYGAFLDWGLEKDLFVPFQNQRDKMQPGSKYVVYVYLDENSDRIVATAKYEKYLNKNPEDLREGDEADLLIVGFTDLGIKVIINNCYQGILYKNEVFRQLKLGERTIGYIRKIREDQKIDVSLQRSGYAEVPDAAEQILQKLKASGGRLPLSDNSTPEAIYDTLGMSKKTFKKALGSLYRNGRVIINPDSISINAQQ